MKSPIKSVHIRRLAGITVLVCFILTSLNIPLVRAQEFPLPVPGTMVHLSPEFNFAHLRGMAIHKEDPFHIDFFINKGEQALSDAQKKSQYKELIKYFLAALAVPDVDQWVNLSPYEKNRIISGDFANTTMGRDLLAEDYMLKQITASLIYPEGKIGKKFWSRIYSQAQKQFGTTNIPVNTFNKVWIVPEKAVVYEDARSGSVYIVESKLKVMLEQDYLALKKNTVSASHAHNNGINALGSQIVRTIVIPELITEVNGGKVKGIDQDPSSNEVIYQRYLRAFKKGAFNYIKEDIDPATQETVPRKYFSGGFSRMLTTRNNVEQAMIVLKNPAQLSPGAREQFANEAMLGQIDLASADFEPIKLNNGFSNNAMLSIKNLTFGLGKAGLITLIMMQLCCSNRSSFNSSGNSNVLSPKAQQLLNNESKLYGIALKESPEKGLNDIVMRYFRNNGNNLFSPYDDMPNLKEIMSNIRIEKSSHPYQEIVQIIRRRVVALKSAHSQAELDVLSREVVLYFQRLIVSVLNANIPYYNSGQNSVARLIYGIDGKHLYNCVAISTFAVMVGHEMGIDVYEEEVKTGEDGTVYPVNENGQLIGHVDNVIKGENGFAHLDQGLDTHPPVVESPETFDEIIRDLQAGQIYKDYKLSMDKLIHGLDAADNLFKIGKYSEAQKMYTATADKADREYRRFQGKSFPKGLVREDQITPVTSDELLAHLDQLSKTARTNAQAAKHNSSQGNGARNIPQQSPGQNTVHPNQGVDSYNDLINKINSLNSRAGDAFNNHNYTLAAEYYRQVMDLIDGSDSKDQLSKARGLAKNNQTTALNNLMVGQLNSLVSAYNDFVNNPNKSIVRTKMEDIIDQSNKALETQSMSNEMKGKFEKLRNAAQKRLNDLAMNTPGQPVGGIDFNSRNLDLQIKGDSGQISLPVDPIAWGNLKILGLVPTIIEIKPVSDWGTF